MMTAAELSAWIAAFVVPAGGAVAFVKFLLARVDAKHASERADRDQQRKDEQDRQDELREELRKDLQNRIAELQNTINKQAVLVNGLMGHIRVLEQRMAKAGLEIPELNVTEIVGRL